jgi:bifunctional DNA-binding transcriptional regulator/antitoxin component of YhaV-PrlF toxin-antitoxin module
MYIGINWYIMGITTITLNDKSFRIVIPEAIRIEEDIQIGDILRIEISKVLPRKGITNKEIENKAKNRVGRPREQSDRPCGVCGHYEDIHEQTGKGEWNGKCNYKGCSCQGFTKGTMKKSEDNPKKQAVKGGCVTCGHPESSHDETTGFCLAPGCKCNVMVYKAKKNG